MDIKDDAYYRLIGRRPPIKKVTIEDLRRGRRIMAGIIAQYGDVYLPIFIRLDKELQQAEENERMKKLALEIAAENET
jgi:hypothetical protein